MLKGEANPQSLQYLTTTVVENNILTHFLKKASQNNFQEFTKFHPHYVNSPFQNFKTADASNMTRKGGILSDEMSHPLHMKCTLFMQTKANTTQILSRATVVWGSPKKWDKRRSLFCMEFPGI